MTQKQLEMARSIVEYTNEQMSDLITLMKKNESEYVAEIECVKIAMNLLNEKFSVGAKFE